MSEMTDAEEQRDDFEPAPTVEPDIDAILDIIRKDGIIDDLEGDQKDALGSIGRQYQVMQNDLHGNTAAIRKVRSLMKGTQSKAFDFMRTFLPLAKRAGLFPDSDLVDKAMKTPPAVPKKGAKGSSRLDAASDSVKNKQKPGDAKPEPKFGPEGDPDLAGDPTQLAPDQETAETPAAAEDDGADPGTMGKVAEVKAAAKSRAKLSVVGGTGPAPGSIDPADDEFYDPATDKTATGK